jgi:MFS family permease
MEFSLTFLAAERFGYTPTSMFKIFVFLGVILILTQGGIVRYAVPRFGEKRVLLAGLLLTVAGMLVTGFAPTLPWLYAGLLLLGVGSGLVNPSISTLVSLYSGAGQQGRMLGVFRSLGSLARGLSPLTACLIYWWKGGPFLYALTGIFLLVPVSVGLRLPQPKK